MPHVYQLAVDFQAANVLQSFEPSLGYNFELVDLTRFQYESVVV